MIERFPKTFDHLSLLTGGHSQYLIPRGTDAFDLGLVYKAALG